MPIIPFHAYIFFHSLKTNYMDRHGVITALHFENSLHLANSNGTLHDITLSLTPIRIMMK